MSDQPIPAPKPRFLTFLCLLTFFSSTSGLWSASERLWNPGVATYQDQQNYEQMQEQMEEQDDGANTEFLARFYDDLYESLTPDNIRIIAIILLIYNSLTLYGAYEIWTLERRGFYIYLAGLSVAILAPLLFVGGWLGAVITLGSGFGSIIMALFYRKYLKYMA